MNAYVKKKLTMKDRRDVVRQILLGRTFRSILSFAMIGFGVLYIWQVNTVSSKGYVISDYERQVSSLERETRSIDVAIAEHTSIVTVRERLVDEQFEPVTNAEYVSVTSDAVAKR